MALKVTEQQRSALEILEWLYSSEPRRSGRTWVLAMSVVRQMCHRPGEWIYFMDHIGVGGERVIFEDIEMLVRALGLRSEITPGRSRVRVSAGTPVTQEMINALYELETVPAEELKLVLPSAPPPKLEIVRSTMWEHLEEPQF